MIIGSRYIFLENLTSTNSWLLKQVKIQRLQEGTVIYTDFQTGGRGQMTNKWESEKGKNLLFSFILYPRIVTAGEQFIISKAISLGISDWLLSIITDVSIKWPNDIYVKNDKIAGILIETTVMRESIENLIAGIGLNINQKVFLSGAPNPVSLSLITGKEFNLSDCLKEVAGCVDKRYRQMLAERKNSLSAKRQVIDEDYQNRLYRWGNWCDYNDSRGHFEGRIVAVTATGRLQIEDRRGRIYEYNSGEVDYI